MRTGFSLLLLAVGLAAPVGGQEMLVVEDSVGTVLGPVLSVAEPRNPRMDYFTFVYRMGSDFVVLNALSSGAGVEFPPNSNRLYFSSLDCSGTPAFALIENLPANADPGNSFPGPVLFGTEGQIWRADTGSVTSPVLVGSRRQASRFPSDSIPCIQVAPAATIGQPVTLIGTIAFTPPLAIAINPLVFNMGSAQALQAAGRTTERSRGEVEKRSIAGRLDEGLTLACFACLEVPAGSRSNGASP